jgi:hypothetical protein
MLEEAAAMDEIFNESADMPAGVSAETRTRCFDSQNQTYEAAGYPAGERK